MAFFRFPHPWDPRYALPGAVLSEPPGRGTLVTKGLRRGTIDTVRTSSGKWAVPGYVMAESGQGAITTAPLPRRFVDAKAPDYLARSKIITRKAPVKRFNPRRGSLSGTVFDNHTLSRSSLGDTASYGRAGRDPFRGFGVKAASAVMSALDRVAPSARESTLRQIFDAIDPSLWLVVAKRGADLEAQGVPAKEALRRAIASSMTDGLVDEIVELGRSGKPGPLTGLGSTAGTRLSGSGSYVGLGSTAPGVGPHIKVMGLDMIYKFIDYDNVIGTRFYNIIATRVIPYPYRSLVGSEIAKKLDEWGEFRSDATKAVNMKLWDGRTGKQTAISGADTSVPLVLAVSFPAPLTSTHWDKQSAIGFILKKKPSSDFFSHFAGLFVDLFKSIPKAAAKTVTHAVEDVVDAVADAACSVVNSDVGAAAVVGASAAKGSPEAGAAAVGIGRGVCGGGPAPPPPPPPAPFPILPIAIAGAGALLLIMGMRE